MTEIAKLRRLRKLLREIMEAGQIMLMCDEEIASEIIKLSGARGVA